jgi:copper(I)-binding protein
MTIEVFFNILMLMMHHFFRIHRPALPNAPILGAFMEISNHSDSDIKLLSANTKGYKRLELHKTW